MERKLFCEWHPITYKISVLKGILFRKIKWLFGIEKYASQHVKDLLPCSVYKHQSVIRRKLGNVNMTLQENKAINLSLATPKVNGIIIKPKEVFSFWRLVGNCSKAKGFKEGLVIKGNNVSKGIGGGMCQFSNLIHWLVLHSPLDITEHHHHNKVDLFPDNGRKVPFGTGTSIMYNYLDYQFTNNTDQIFQLVIYTTDDYLYGELRCEYEFNYIYDVVEEDHYFIKDGEDYYRHNKVFKLTKNKLNSTIEKKELIVENYSRVLYDHNYINGELRVD